MTALRRVGWGIISGSLIEEPHPVIRLLFSLLMFGSAAVHAQPLLAPAELAGKLGDSKLRIVDIRDGQAGKSAYDAGHIAGAQHASYAQWRGPAESPGTLPTTDALKALIQQLGIDSTTPVVVVVEGKSSTDFGAAARVYWTLKAAGIPKLSVLNGGMTAWRAAGLPLSTETSLRAPSTFQVKLNPRFIATRDEVVQVVNSGSARLLDARPAAYFVGETRHTAAKTPGTIVGAKNVSHEVWFTRDARLLPADDIKRAAHQAGVNTDQPTISFCNTGHWAATNWFVLSELLGHENVKLYPESVVEWSNAGLAMDNIPGRLQQFWTQLKVASGAP
ncbi:MAG TPA: sulfurtransferase [Burkholderiaceae bacterium]|nr:sulfurtransferase [Burkholderiaceae bacterium]